MGTYQEVRKDAATSSVTSQLESISSLKEEQRKAMKAFLNGKHGYLLTVSVSL